MLSYGRHVPLYSSDMTFSGVLEEGLFSLVIIRTLLFELCSRVNLIDFTNYVFNLLSAVIYFSFALWSYQVHQSIKCFSGTQFNKT